MSLLPVRQCPIWDKTAHVDISTQHNANGNVRFGMHLISWDLADTALAAIAVSASYLTYS